MSVSCKLFLNEVESLFLDLEIESNKRLPAAHLKALIILTLLLEHVQGIYDLRHRLIKESVALGDVNKVMWQRLFDKIPDSLQLLNKEIVSGLIAQTLNDLSIADSDIHQKVLVMISRYQLF